VEKKQESPNYIRHLTATFEKIDATTGFTPFHTSLYLALFRRWNMNYFQNPISVARDELMRMAQIGSVKTYYRCLKALDRWGFIRYEPSYCPSRGSHIYLFRFDTGGEEVVVSYKNNLNRINEGESPRAKEEDQEEKGGESCSRGGKRSAARNGLKAAGMMRDQGTEADPAHEGERKDRGHGEERSAASGRNGARGYGPDIPPKKEDVMVYFREKGYSQVEAEKFFNYFESNGWLVGGRTKMRDWKAAARNWMLNTKKYNYAGISGKDQRQTGPGSYRGSRERDYSEPL